MKAVKYTANPTSLDSAWPGSRSRDLQATGCTCLVDHEQLTYRFQGRDYRLTGVHVRGKGFARLIFRSAYQGVLMRLAGVACFFDFVPLWEFGLSPNGFGQGVRELGAN